MILMQSSGHHSRQGVSHRHLLCRLKHIYSICCMIMMQPPPPPPLHPLVSKHLSNKDERPPSPSPQHRFSWQLPHPPSPPSHPAYPSPRCSCQLAQAWKELTFEAAGATAKADQQSVETNDAEVAEQKAVWVLAAQTGLEFLAEASEEAEGEMAEVPQQGDVTDTEHHELALK